MNKVIYDKGQIKIINKESNPFRGVLSFTDRLTLETLVKKYINYKTLLHGEIVKTFIDERETLNKFINENNAEDYYIAKLEDNRTSFLNIIMDYTGISAEDRVKASNDAILFVLDNIEYNLSINDKNTLEWPIKPLELNYWFTQCYIKAIIELLYRNGYEQIPIEIGDFIVTYYNIISGTGNTITFPKDNKEAGVELRGLFYNTLLSRYTPKINIYVRIEEE